MLASALLGPLSSAAQASPVGLWQVDYPGKVSGATQGIWQDSKLRISPDGTFKEYGGLGLSGRYTVKGTTAHLSVEKQFHRTVRPGGSFLGGGLDLWIRRPDLLELAPLPQLRDQSRVVWRPAKREPIRTLIVEVSKIETNEDGSKNRRLRLRRDR